MTKETILKRLLLENHITIEELIILAEGKQKEPVVYGPNKSKNDLLNKWLELERKNKNNLMPGFYYSTTPYHESLNIVSSKL